MRPLVRTAALSGYVELCRSLGIDPQSLLKRVGLDTAALTVQDRWISGTAAVQVLELSAAESGHEDFGVLLAEFRRFSNLGPISLVVREEPDVRSALELLIRHQYMYNEVLHTRLSEGDGLATLKVDLRLGEAMESRQATELAVAAYHRILSDFLHTRWQPLSVWFRMPRRRTPRRTGARSGPSWSSTARSTASSSTPMTSTRPTPWPTRCCASTPSSTSTRSPSPRTPPQRTRCAS